MGTSLRIPGVKCLIKIFAEAVHGRNGYVIMVNATNVVTKEWNGIIDYQIIGTCDEWVKLVDMELSSVKERKKEKETKLIIVIKKGKYLRLNDIFFFITYKYVL
ncbi:hypothetical protein C2G38_2168835 [Gigaspora rosea]|uniref:Uncharacterized protein n=1 Tax=Gigaspora rosea TaxID=44941 RepID=A0A397VSQ3_9GLOM|nr:hypothetical protein C2G38_2168835 [Gigaspora rosea]